jgi:CheY-like chemotaxis protein
MTPRFVILGRPVKVGDGRRPYKLQTTFVGAGANIQDAGGGRQKAPRESNKHVLRWAAVSKMYNMLVPGRSASPENPLMGLQMLASPEDRRAGSSATTSQLILLVEDDFVLRGALTELLRDEGYQVECAASGIEALKRLDHAPAPSLVLLDIMLPYMDGLEFRAAQLASPAMADIPVIVISAVGTGPDADRFHFARTFSKPIDTVKLLASIREVLEPDGA